MPKNDYDVHESGRTDAETHRTRCDWGERDGLLVAVTRAISEVTGTGPPDLPPLDESVDTDALRALFRPTRAGPIRSRGSVTFGHAGCRVTVHATGRVVVRSEGD